MFDQSKLQDVLKQYKQDFHPYLWEESYNGKEYDGERFKWVAVNTFRREWKPNAPDFADMLNRSLAGTKNILASAGAYPKSMITRFAKNDPEKVRAMFLNLFAEEQDIVNRISAFKTDSQLLLDTYGKEGESHFQDEKAIMTYLWLRYPDKYYIYRYSESRKMSEVLESNYPIKKGAYAQNIRNYLKLYDEVCAAISKDEELTSMLREHLADDCYPDPEYRTLTFDISFYISHHYAEGITARGRYEKWFPEDYSPEISTDTWIKLLHNSEVFTDGSLEIMKRMKDYGGQATCSQLATKYGETKNFYNSGSVSLARRVSNETGCPLNYRDEESVSWWTILYVGRDADQNEEGIYVWKLRDELSAALDIVDLSDTKLYAAAPGNSDCRYWWLNANPKIWSFSEMTVGETQSYTLYNDNGNKRRIFQNFLNVKAGDMVIGYESNPVKQIVSICQITAEQDGKKIQFEKTESLASPINYATLKSVPELEKMEFFANPNGSLFRLTKDEYDFLMDVIREENPLPGDETGDVYSKDDFLREVFMSEQSYDRLVGVLKNKRNIILQGAPGVGKTFTAKRLAYSVMGERDDSRIEFVQFHQNYSYEDFMMGYKPAGDGFELKTGIFYRFCQKAENQPNKEFFFIIDEINRGNMSKIFGELLMMIESDYRGTKTTLAYNGMSFSVPKNLYIIGMMNTADRSLAMIDYALRRRFSFFDIEPGFDADGFSQYQKELDNETFDQLINTVRRLNEEISNDKSLGKGFCIGHSYFSNWKECTDEKMRAVVDYDIIPMLTEYWFDDDKKLQEWSNNLHGVFQ